MFQISLFKPYKWETGLENIGEGTYISIKIELIITMLLSKSTAIQEAKFH